MAKQVQTPEAGPGKEPVWLDTEPIQKLFARGKEAGSLDTEEISTAFAKALDTLGHEPDDHNFEDLMERIEKQGISIADLAEDEVLTTTTSSARSSPKREGARALRRSRPAPRRWPTPGCEPTIRCGSTCRRSAG